MLVKEEGNVMLAKLLHPENALSLSFVTPSKISYELVFLLG